MPTGGHPVVYGEWLNAGKHAPTVMIYGHYDVQPPDPLELWTTPPFEAAVRGDNLYARGSADMKGQVIASLKAVEAVMKSGDMPINLKWLIEGEEEIGSEHLDDFIKNHKELLACDFCLNMDAGILGEDRPSITTGLRGLAYFELRVYGPSKDLHSGLYGGTVHNPAQALAELIAGMHDKNGKVTLPGFYDKVRKLSKKEHQDFARLPISGKENQTTIRRACIVGRTELSRPPNASVRGPRLKSMDCFRASPGSAQKQFCLPGRWRRFHAASFPIKLRKKPPSR